MGIKLSVIVPHYNTPQKLNRLLKTIPVNLNLEVIVVDDHSDQYLEELNSISAKFLNNNSNFLFLKNDLANKGAGTARNEGLNIARGKYVLFADADDMFKKGFFETVKSNIEDNYDIVFFKPTSLNSNLEIGSRHKKYECLINRYLKTPSHKNKLLLQTKFYVPWSKLFRKKFIQENNIYFDETLVSNDVMFSTKAGIFAQNIRVSDSVIYIATQSDKGLTTKKDRKTKMLRFKTNINYIVFLKNVLSKNDYNSLYLNPIFTLLNYFRYDYSIKDFLKCYQLFKKSNIKVFTIRNLNPINIYKKITNC